MTDDLTDNKSVFVQRIAISGTNAHQVFWQHVASFGHSELNLLW